MRYTCLVYFDPAVMEAPGFDKAGLDRRSKAYDEELQAGGHFLGAVVFKARSAIAGDVTRHSVIDGQQRTTTLQILLDAVHAAVSARGHEDEAEALEELILNKAKRFAGKPERFKLWPARSDRAARPPLAQADQAAVGAGDRSALGHRLRAGRHAPGRRRRASRFGPGPGRRCLGKGHAADARRPRRRLPVDSV